MARVLVVDDDPWTQRMVSAVLAHRGHVVDIASDGWEGLIRSGRVRPDLVIVSMRLPTTDGRSFVTTLRSRAETAQVPALFLTTMGNDRKAHRNDRGLPNEQTLEKPFRMEELEQRASLLLGEPLSTFPSDLPGLPDSTRLTPTYGLPLSVSGPTRGETFGVEQAGNDGLRPTPTQVTAVGAGFLDDDIDVDFPDVDLHDEPQLRSVLTGDLTEFGLSSVLIVLELERKSGAVVLLSGAGLGQLWLRDGRVIRAQVEGDTLSTGALAVYEMLGWSEGRFDFSAGVVTGEDEIGTSTSFLLMEGARLQDERGQGKTHN